MIKIEDELSTSRLVCFSPQMLLFLQTEEEEVVAAQVNERCIQNKMEITRRKMRNCHSTGICVSECVCAVCVFCVGGWIGIHFPNEQAPLLKKQKTEKKSYVAPSWLE